MKLINMPRESLHAASSTNGICPVLVAMLLVFGLLMCSHAQAAGKLMPKEVSAVLADYEKELAKAKEPNDRVLRAEATRIAARLVAEGNADAAKQISSQVEDKAAGKPVADAAAELVKLFALYDSAVVSAAKPIRERYTRRIDTLLQGPAGKDMTMVLSLAEAKRVIGAEPPGATPSSIPPIAEIPSSVAPQPANSIVTTPARGKKTLADLVEGKTWEFKTSSGIDLFSFEKRGKLRWLRSGGASAGVFEYRWEAGDDVIVVGNNSSELRFDASGSFGEVLFSSTKNRYRLSPSSQTIPER
jgi:hypothetical protein